MTRTKSLKTSEIQRENAQDAYPDREARDRFERAVDVAVVTKPMHRQAKPQKKRRKR